MFGCTVIVFTLWGRMGLSGRERENGVFVTEAKRMGVLYNVELVNCVL